MTIRKRGKTYQIDYFDITGKRVRKSGFKTRAEAQIAESEAITNKSKGLSNIVDKNITVKEACEYFKENYAKHHCKQKTYDEYCRIIDKIIILYFGNTKLINLTKMDVESFRNSLIDKNLSNASINKYVTLLGSIIERQIENGTIFQNVAKRVKNLPNNSKESRALTKDEINKVLQKCKEIKPNFYPMLYTFIKGGLRRGEAIALMWENVNFEKNVIYIKYSEYKGKLVTPKSKKSYRTIQMSSSLRKVLIEQKLKTGNGKFVFPNSEGGMFCGNNIYHRYIVPLVEASGIGHFKCHDLRHTYGSQLIENGISPKFVQGQLGHASAKMTLDIYTHEIEERSEKAMKILDNLDEVS